MEAAQPWDQVPNGLKSILAQLCKYGGFGAWEPFHEIGFVELLRMVLSRAPELPPVSIYDLARVGRVSSSTTAVIINRTGSKHNSSQSGIMFERAVATYAISRFIFRFICFVV